MKKSMLTLAIAAMACAGFAQQNSTHKIDWPDNYKPSTSKFYVHNEIEIKAKPDIVWDYLIDALKWEQWYVGAKHVSFVNSTDSLLNPSSVFTWETMGLRFQSAIKVFEPNRLLAWESRKKSIQGYHVWLIVPTETGCLVITDESQNGWLTLLEKTFQRKKLKRLHDVWLMELKKKAELPNQTL